LFLSDFTNAFLFALIFVLKIYRFERADIFLKMVKGLLYQILQKHFMVRDIIISDTLATNDIKLNNLARITLARKHNSTK